MLFLLNLRNLYLWHFWIILTQINFSETKEPDFDQDQPKLFQQIEGKEVMLRCGIRSSHADYMTSSEVQWSFKPCGEGYNKTSCRASEIINSLPWVPVNCSEAPCKPTLIIKNATESDSGLYKCSVHPYRPDNHTVLGIHIARTYQLDVIGNGTITVPEFLNDLPSNTTATKDSQVVLQCKVHSKIPPEIRWFRKKNNDFSDVSCMTDCDKVIQNLESTFESLESSGEKELSQDTYLSKLILNNVTEEEIGFYVCVGINYRGYRIRGAFVNIIRPTEEFTSGKYKLLWLFSIPIVFAIIPLSMWICFSISKRRRGKASNEDPLMRPTATTGTAAINNTTILITNNYDNRHFTTINSNKLPHWYYL